MSDTAPQPGTGAVNNLAWQVLGGRLYTTTEDHLIDDSSLSLVDTGLINTMGAQVSKWFPNLISVVLCFSGDTQSDFSRLRQIQASVNNTHQSQRPATGPTFPAMCINRVDIGFDAQYRPTQSDKNVAITESGKTSKAQPCVLRYAVRIYTQSYKLATRCLEALVLNRQVQFIFAYLVPWIQTDPFTGTYSIDIPQITETSSFPTQEAEGPVYMVSFNITARATLFSPPDIFANAGPAAIVYTTITNFHYISMNGRVIDKIWCWPCEDWEPVFPPMVSVPNPRSRQ